MCWRTSSCWVRELKMPTFDCKNSTPTIKPPSIYFECWGNRRLPSSIQFSIGPTTLIPPNTTLCLNWPATVITGSLSKGLFGTNMCSPIWSGISNGFGIVFNYQQYSTNMPISCSINVLDMTGTWSLGTTEANVTYSNTSGSCSQDPITKIVTMIFTTIANNGSCSSPITVTFNG